MIRSAWAEYEADETLEAHFVHDVDKLELLLQMMEYERREEGKVDLGEFVRVADKIQLEEMRQWSRDVLRERLEFWKGKGTAEVGMMELTNRLVQESEGEKR